MALAHPKQIILFGSAVSGRMRSDSDLDFLVVVSEGDQPEMLTDRLNLGIRNRPMPCDFMVVRQSTLERHRDNPGLIYSAILDEGKEVYAA